MHGLFGPFIMDKKYTIILVKYLNDHLKDKDRYVSTTSNYKYKLF